MMLGHAISLIEPRRPHAVWTLPSLRAADQAGGPPKGPAFAFDLRRNMGVVTTIAPAGIAAAAASTLTAAVRSAGFTELFAFGRAGPATYLDAAGVVRTASADTPRYDWSNGARQLLLEASTANLLLQSRDCSASAWGAVSLSSVRGQAGVFADTDAWAIGGSATESRLQQSVALTAGQTYCFWACLKPGTAAISKLQAYDTSNAVAYETTIDWAGGGIGSSGPGTVTPFLLPFAAGFSKAGFSFTPAGGSVNLQLRPGLGTVFVDGMQLEPGTAATSCIPTTGAAITRAADNCRLADPAAALLQRSAVSVVVRGQNLRGAYGIFVGGAAASRLIGFNGTQNNVVLGATSILNLASIALPLPRFGVAARWNPAGKAGSYNGGAVQSSAVQIDTTFSKASLGRAETGNPATGHYDFIAIYPFEMTDAALQAKAVPQT